MIEQFNQFFNKQSLASTYKPTFVKCLLDIGDCNDSEGKEWVEDKEEHYNVDLNFIVARFLRYYHPLKFKYKLKQEATKNTIAIYDILETYKDLVGIKSTPPLKKFCSKKFSDMRETTIKNPAIQQQVMPKLLNDCNIYEHDSKKILIKKEVVDYMKRNRSVLKSALNNMIAIYLEKCNKKVPDVSTKLLEEIRRKKLSPSKFEKITSLGDSCCFYCGKKSSYFEQEHFIPWNFIPQSENYNIVPACKKCNSSKSDKLPVKKYLDEIIERNKKLENLPVEYSEEFMKTSYENCRSEYHGINERLWEP
ncbi:HNH endonuclease protein [Marine Group I thaumarchaeote SCGC RSA3]|uniref:HNH endonuclease protein n=3 Tax=Marine Group I TaxID=905826 RepID=A0A081RMG5_9ARCH|nr:HNH endonuclease protein [Marine Group I thaumarchaeote SCGC AAA799-N04]KFM16661.1 HNH endonuclease protein [Marine Group I thaumarchaeote SCGC AAA799-D11]KFM18714.1 HNH endonuclease protein [Marine Group I thaumarchaeote SCGC RSA3]